MSDLFNNMSDEELDAVVGGILSCHPNTGYKMMMGHLNARGIRIQSKCIVLINVFLCSNYMHINSCYVMIRNHVITTEW